MCAAGISFGNAVGERFDDRVDDRRQGPAPARHRRRKPRHHHVAFLNLDLERAERAFVDRLERAGDAFVGDVRAGQRAARSSRRGVASNTSVRSIVRSVPLTTTSTRIGTRDRPGRRRRGRGYDSASYVPSGMPRDDEPALRFGLVEDALDRGARSSSRRSARRVPPSRRSASLQAAICERISPIDASGKRMLSQISCRLSRRATPAS